MDYMETIDSEEYLSLEDEMLREVSAFNFS
jgi:hypothetical protein